MRFCLIGPVWPYRGGISHNSAIIANALLKDGQEILLISFDRQYPLWLYPGRTDRDNSKNPLQTPAKFVLDPFSPFSWKKTADMIVDYQPDLVLLQWWTTFWSIPYAMITWRLQKNYIRLTYVIHNVIPHESHPLDHILTRLALNRVHDFLVFSDLEKNKLHHILPGKRIIQSSLPVYSFTEGNKISKNTARNSLNIPIDVPLLLFFGFVRHYKGLHIILQALKCLKDEGCTPTLAIVGEFWRDKNIYLEMIKNFELEDQVRIEDRYVPNEEADLWFRATDIVLAPYIEGVTQSAVASLAAGYGTPMIVSDQVAAGMEHQNYSIIRIVPAGDIDALAKEIAASINNFRNYGNLSSMNTTQADHVVKSLKFLASNHE